MAVPIIVGVGVAAAAAYSAKKGMDAKGDFKDAKEYQERADYESKAATTKLENQRKKTLKSLERYGQSKKDGIDKINEFNSLICYPEDENKDGKLQVEFKKRIKITHEEEIDILKSIGVISKKMSLEEATQTVNANHVELNKLAGALQSVAVGTLAGIAAGGGAYFGVGALASVATTGTAISSLSGAAATNATLAWLGGGALKAGGMGIAGGTMVMGMVVAAPLLAVSASIIASKAADKKDEAREELSRVRTEIKQLEIVISQLDAIICHTNECNQFFYKALIKWESPLQKFKELADLEVRYKDLNSNDKEIVMLNYKFAYFLSDFINLGTINEQGNGVNESSQELLKNKKLENALN